MEKFSEGILLGRTATHSTLWARLFSWHRTILITFPGSPSWSTEVYSYDNRSVAKLLMVVPQERLELPT